MDQLLRKMNLHREEYVCTEKLNNSFQVIFVKVGSKKDKSALIIELKTSISLPEIEDIIADLPSLYE